MLSGLIFDKTNQEDRRPHQTQKFDGRPTSGLEEVIMGCTSRRSKGMVRAKIQSSHIHETIVLGILYI